MSAPSEPLKMLINPNTVKFREFPGVGKKSKFYQRR